VSQYRAVTGRTDEPRILVLLDNLGGFLKAYEANDAWIDRLVAIAGAGRPVGVHVVVTTDRSGGVPTQLASTIQRRLVLRMPSLDEYDNCGVPRTMVTSASHPGRGIWDGHEVQVGVLGSSADLGDQAREMDRMARALQQSGAPVARTIERLPEQVLLSSLPNTLGGEVVIGMADDTLGPLAVLPEGTLAVAGPPGSGRTSAVETVCAAIGAAHPGCRRYLLTLDRRSPLLRSVAWTERAVGVDEVQALADRLTLELDREVDRATVIVVEKVAEWSDSPAEYALESLVKNAVRAGALVVTDGEATTYSRGYGLAASANTSRAGILLQPDPGDGSGFGVDLPVRLKRSEFPPGRGFLVRRGRATLAQVAISGDTEKGRQAILSPYSATRQESSFTE
jgi:S-DNA-T family DNA segregation ATPase FtsK/SpoIIIE